MSSFLSEKVWLYSGLKRVGRQLSLNTPKPNVLNDCWPIVEWLYYLKDSIQWLMRRPIDHTVVTRSAASYCCPCPIRGRPWRASGSRGGREWGSKKVRQSVTMRGEKILSDVTHIFYSSLWSWAYTRRLKCYFLLLFLKVCSCDAYNLFSRSGLKILCDVIHFLVVGLRMKAEILLSFVIF